MELTVAELAERLKADLVGSGAGVIRAVGPIGSADAATVTFAADKRHSAALRESRAGAVIVSETIAEVPQAVPQLVVTNVNATLIEVLKIFAPKLKTPAAGVDATARLGQGVKIGKGASIGAWVLIDDGAEIGDETVIAAGCKIGENTKMGKHCRLDCNVAVYHNCSIGDNVIIQANSTIGSTGFGYSFIDGQHRLIPHNGTVVIEDFVEIGANCCVDRAKFGETRIGAGTKIDNLVQIAHNVVIGRCCLLAGQVGISGSCTLGDGVVLGGQVGLADNIRLGDGVMVGAQSGVIGDIEAGMHVVGYPAVDRKRSLRATASLLRLPKMLEELRQLCARVEKLEAAKDDSQPGGP